MAHIVHLEIPPDLDTIAPVWVMWTGIVCSAGWCGGDLCAPVVWHGEGAVCMAGT
jgi:hypothetical protein